MKADILVASALSILGLTGCMVERAAMARSAQQSMIGLSKEGVLACMGAPINHASVGETEVWSYMSGNGRVQSSEFVTGGNGIVSGLGVTTQRFCKIDVVMTAGRVSRINYSGPTGGLISEGEQCAYAVSNCMQPQQ